MENYKEKLKVQNRITGFCCAVLLLVSALGFLSEAGFVPFLTPIAGDESWKSMWRGFISGATMGVGALMLFGLARSMKALKDEKALKQLYIKEHDERAIQIWTAARASAMQTFLLLGLAAMIVAGYFSIAVSVTLLVCVLANSLLGMGFKVYYSKKF